MPKQGIIAGEKGYITVDNYPRANTAILVYPNGEKETIVAGKTEQAMVYEIQGVEKAIASQNYALGSIETTSHVVSMMDHLLHEAGLSN